MIGINYNKVSGKANRYINNYFELYYYKVHLLNLKGKWIFMFSQGHSYMIICVI